MTAVAEAWVTLRPQTEGFGREAKKGIAGAFGPIGAAAAAGMAVVGAAIAGTAVKGVQAFASFERSMNEVFTLLPGISGHAMDAMSDQVMEFSKEFGTLPEEVVPALYQALSAGVPQDNVFTFLEVAQKAAIAGVTELETAVDGISSVVNAYGSDVLSAAEASDVMFTAVRLGKTNFEELSSSLFNVIPTAASLGVSFEDVAAGLATITAQGTPTTVATTQMRQLFVELSRAGGEVATTFGDLAGKSFQEFIAEGNNVQDALGLLERHAEDSNLSLADLFGSVEAGSAALGLTGQATSAFAEALAEMGTSAGATEAAYATMDQGMSRAMDKLKAGWEVIKLHIGESLQPAVQAFADWVIENMPAIEQHITSFFQGVGLVAETVVGIFTSSTEDFNRQMDGWDSRFGRSAEVMDGWHATAKDDTDGVLQAFENLAEYIEDELVPSLQSISDWWDKNLGPMLKAFNSADTAFRNFQEGYLRFTESVGDFFAPFRRGVGAMPQAVREARNELFGQHHQGGIFGEGGTQRNIFSHPLRSNEGMAVLERGEEILPVGHPRHVGSGGKRGGHHYHGDIIVNYPAPERASESIPRALERLSFLGGG